MFPHNFYKLQPHFRADVMLRQPRIQAARASPGQKWQGLRVVLFQNLFKATFFVFWVNQLVDIFLSHLPVKQIWRKRAVCYWSSEKLPDRCLICLERLVHFGQTWDNWSVPLWKWFLFWLSLDLFRYRWWFPKLSWNRNEGKEFRSTEDLFGFRWGIPLVLWRKFPLPMFCNKKQNK